MIAGPSSLDLQLKSSAKDTDLQVTLSEVRPDGNETYVQNGWLRASHRKLDAARSTALDPVPTHLKGDAAPLPRGHVLARARPDLPGRARVPRGLAHPGDGRGGRRRPAALGLRDGRRRSATNTIAIGGPYGSQLVLPVRGGGDGEGHAAAGAHGAARGAEPRRTRPHRTVVEFSPQAAGGRCTVARMVRLWGISGWPRSSCAFAAAPAFALDPEATIAPGRQVDLRRPALADGRELLGPRQPLHGGDGLGHRLVRRQAGRAGRGRALLHVVPGLHPREPVRSRLRLGRDDARSFRRTRRSTQRADPLLRVPRSATTGSS